MNKTGVIVFVLITVLISAGLVYWRLSLSGPRGQISLKDQASSVKLPKIEEKELSPGSKRAQASSVLHVNNPVALRALMKQNAWLNDVLSSPLGKGFGAGWSAFLQTKGEDLKARFSGPIFDYLVDKVFTQPFVIAWISDGEATGAPAFVIDAPKSAASTAFETLTALTARGVLNAANCPGEKPGKEPKYKIVRWLVADQPLYAVLAADRLVVAAKPTAALQGLCLDAETTKASKPALELALYPDRFGREAQLFSVLLGAEQDLRLPFEIDQNRLVPKGIAAALATDAHLAVAAPSDELLKLIPEDMPVAVLLQLKLPKTLTADTLAKFFKDGSGETTVRQTTLLWDPKGKRDIALIWSVATEKQALTDLFTARGISWRTACGHVIMAGDAAFGDRVERACKGQSPSRLNAQPEIVQGSKAQQSIALHLHLGSLLSSLMVDQYKYERHNASLPPELEQAKKQLEALPFFGFRGRADGKSLVAEGFRS